MKQKTWTTYKIAFIGVMAAVVCVVTFFRFPLLGSKVHFANAMCLLAGLLFFGGPGLFAEVPAGEFALLQAIVLPLYLVMICFAMSVSPTTCASISLEGDRLWILKSLPVSTGAIFGTKVRLHLMLTVPVALLASLSALAVFHPSDPLMLAALFLIPLLFSLFAGLCGLAVNLLLPNLTWKNPVVPVKKGAAVLVTMLIDFLMIALPIVLHAAVGIGLNTVLCSCDVQCAACDLDVVLADDAVACR